MEVGSMLLRVVQMYCAVDGIFLADTQASNRLATGAVVVRTPFHKLEAIIKLKRFLAHWNVQEITVRDCFPTDMMERARHLASYGAHLRRTEEQVQRYRVTDKNGELSFRWPVEMADTCIKKLTRRPLKSWWQAWQTTKGGRIPNPEKLVDRTDQIIR